MGGFVLFAALYAQSPGAKDFLYFWRGGQTRRTAQQRRLGHDLGQRIWRATRQVRVHGGRRAAETSPMADTAITFSLALSKDRQHCGACAPRRARCERAEQMVCFHGAQRKDLLCLTKESDWHRGALLHRGRLLSCQGRMSAGDTTYMKTA